MLSKTLVSRCHHLHLPLQTLPNQTRTRMDSRSSGPSFAFRGHKSSSSFFEQDSKSENNIILEEWQGWGTTSQVPSMVRAVIEDLKSMEKDSNHQMDFGGLGGKLQGNFKVQEDKKHRAKYQALRDSEEKLQFFSARQIACRLLGSKGYLCQKCWLALEDCMCSKITPSSLWNGIRFWLYMHPKDFLRQNNTGKVLWQTFGVHAAMLCIYGIPEHEEIMWSAFKRAGKNRVWCLYPNKNAATKSVHDIIIHPQASDNSCQPETNGVDEPINFILIDGTWSNSAAMVSRLKERVQVTWGTKDDLSCISLSALGASSMHRLRPQPSWDRTCTAAAAIGLLTELHQLPELSSHGLDTQAELLENALDALLDALTTRRLRKGRSITRTEKHRGDVC